MILPVVAGDRCAEVSMRQLADRKLLDHPGGVGVAAAGVSVALDDSGLMWCGRLIGLATATATSSVTASSVAATRSVIGWEARERRANMYKCVCMQV